MKKNNVTIQLGAKIEKITRTAKDRGQVEVQGLDPFEADCVLFTMGRTPLTEPLNLQNLDLELTKYGTVVVNEHFQTNRAHIYAAGDIIGFPSLASTSAAQGRMAALHALGQEIHERPDLFPFAVYSIPEIAMVGKMESELKADHLPYAQGVAFYRENPKASMIGDEIGAIKILFHPETRKVLGVHILGDMASEIIHIGSLAMSFEGTLDDFVDSVFNYPTLSSLYKNAALNGLNSLQGKSTYRNLLPD
jgi:NAD(P) transhydrogenase